MDHSVFFKAEEEEDPCIWECQVRYVTFIGIGRDAHTFGLIADMGKQRFQCTAFWCEPDAGTISEAVQAACMVNTVKIKQTRADFRKSISLLKKLPLKLAYILSSYHS